MNLVKPFSKRISLGTLYWNYMRGLVSDMTEAQILCSLYEATHAERLRTDEDQPWVEIPLDLDDAADEINRLLQVGIIERRHDQTKTLFRLRAQWFEGAEEL